MAIQSTQAHFDLIALFILVDKAEIGESKIKRVLPNQMVILLRLARLIYRIIQSIELQV